MIDSALWLLLASGAVVGSLAMVMYPPELDGEGIALNAVAWGCLVASSALLVIEIYRVVD